MLKILHLVEATLGGVRRHIVDLLSGLHTTYASEVELHFGYSLQRADSNFKSDLEGIKATSIKCFECNMSRAIAPAIDIKMVLQVVRYIRDNEINIVHAHSAKAGYIGRIAARLVPGTRSVYTPHASPFRLSTVYHALEILAGWSFSDAIIAMSETERFELIGNKISRKHKIFVVNGGIPETKHISELNDQVLQKEGRVLSVGTVGRLTAQKAPHRFFEIAKAVVKIKPDVKFIWIGDGELRSSLEELISREGLSNNVYITGWTNEVDKALLQINIFLLPSEYESFGYATVEAMRAGLPCVVSDVPGSRDIVKNGKTGFVVDRSNSNEYVHSIVKLLNDADLRASMGKAGRECWKEEFQASYMVSNTLEIYRNLHISQNEVHAFNY